MKCPTCEADGLKSQVRAQGTSYTLAMVDVFWDDNGRWHKHDPNKYSQSFYCSKGHSWYKIWYPKCPACNFNEEKHIILESKKK